MLRMYLLTKSESVQPPDQGLANDKAEVGRRNYRQSLQDSVRDKTWRRLGTLQTGITGCTKSEMGGQRFRRGFRRCQPQIRTTR
jgi:hypothetical protein